jgi:hypothetical protein
MFCPACGADGQRPDAYCKRCGGWLPDTVGLARRALWGQGTTPEQKVNTMLVRDGVSAILALFSAIALYLSLPDSANWVVKIIIGVSLLIAGIQLDSFMIGFRLRQDFKRIHSDAGTAAKAPEAALPLTRPDIETAQPDETALRERPTELLETSAHPQEKG